MQGFPIMMPATKKIWQKVKYEKHDFYCFKCH